MYCGVMVDPVTLQQIIDYDPASGVMRWRHRPVSMFPCLRTANSWNARYAGAVTAQSKNEWGYLSISIFRRKYPAHRVAWALHHGKWPDGEIDHINRCPSDNRIENLRVVTSLENSRNKGDYSNNTSGYRGVTLHKATGKWAAQIKINKRNIHLGLFSDPVEAANAYALRAAQEFGRGA